MFFIDLLYGLFLYVIILLLCGRGYGQNVTETSFITGVTSSGSNISVAVTTPNVVVTTPSVVVTGPSVVTIPDVLYCKIICYCLCMSPLKIIAIVMAQLFVVFHRICIIVIICVHLWSCLSIQTIGG